jgi:hypothetical protein
VAFGLLPQFLIYVRGLDRPVRLTSNYVDQNVAAIQVASGNLFPRLTEAERFLAGHTTRGSGRPVAYYWGPGGIIAPSLFCPATTPVTAGLMREAVLGYADWAVSVLTGEAIGLGAGLGLRLTTDALGAVVRPSGRIRARTGNGLDDNSADPAAARRARDREGRQRRRHDIARPRLTRGAGADRLPPERFRRVYQQVREDLRLAHDQAVTARGATRREAGAVYQNVIATDIRGGDVQEVFSRPHRRMDVGTGHEVTLEGQHGGFSAAKLDQFWLDLRDLGQILLTVPRLSAAAADQLARLGGQAEAALGREVLIIVRETLSP